VHPPPSPGWANFSIMMENTPGCGHCHSVSTLWYKVQLRVQGTAESTGYSVEYRVQYKDRVQCRVQDTMQSTGYCVE